MILGVGTDIVDIHRVEEVLSRNTGRFPERILSLQELAYFKELRGLRQVEFMAGRFAVKEAMGKALGVGLAGLRPNQVAVTLGSAGLRASWLSKPGNCDYAQDVWHLSISHSQTSAVALAVWERRL